LAGLSVLEIVIFWIETGKKEKKKGKIFPLGKFLAGFVLP